MIDYQKTIGERGRQMEWEEILTTREVTHQMIVTNQMHRRTLECNLEGTGIHRAQHRLLMTLAKKSFVSQVELAQYLEVSPATIAVSLKALKKAELIKKTAKEEDNRINFVELTDKGRKLVEDSCGFFDALDEQMYQGFEQEELHQLYNFFERMYNNMEQMVKKRWKGDSREK